VTTVLVLDDSPTDRELLITVLRFGGYEVIESDSGAAALEIARSERPDVIISDVMMPEMNGLEFARQLREDPWGAQASLVLSTAAELEGELLELAHACGVYRFIPKPTEPGALLQLVAEVASDTPEAAPAVPAADFDRAQLKLLNDKLVEKVNEVEAVNAARQSLIAQLLEAHESERRRIAADIHDDSIQTVIALGMRLEMLANRTEDPEQSAELSSLRDDVEVAIERLRRLIFELQPPELREDGLAAALRLTLEHVKDDEGLLYEVDDRLSSEPAAVTATLIYRLAQEALMNVRKHAEATRVSVTLEEIDGAIRLTLRDDGIGFDADEAVRSRPGHLGLASMRERLEASGGSLQIVSSPGDGSTIVATLPAVVASPTPTLAVAE
jgi:signal transduction histidine kinase